MLVRAHEKAGRNRGRPIKFVEADALSLPFADARFDLVATAFGFRNLANYAEGLRELRRVLKPGGSLAILEFAEPRGSAFSPRFRFLFSPRASGHWRGDLRKRVCLHLSAEFGGPLSAAERAC